MIEYTVPFPPSCNGLFAGKARRYVSKPYARWKKLAGWEMRRQGVRPATGRVVIDIALTAPDRRHRDSSNYIKAIEDLAVSMGVLAGDSHEHVKGVTAHWATEPGEPGARVRIMPA